MATLHKTHQADLVAKLEQRRYRVKRLADQITALEKAQEALLHKVAAYKNYDPEIEKRNVDELEMTRTNISREITDQEANTTELERGLKGLNSAKVSPLSVFKYFSSEQKKIRADASRFVSDLSSSKQKLTNMQDALYRVREDISAARKRMSGHANFNLSDSEQQLSSLGQEIERLRAGHAVENDELAWIESKIRPHTEELDRLKSEVAILKNDMASANRMDQDLSSASNSYERAMIHQECEQRFGTGSPKHVINGHRGKIRSLENNIPKIERRIFEELQKLERNIGRLLIDGNNACYEGQSFIGLRAISALLGELGGRYKTTVVFDASIRALLKTDAQGIERALGPSVNTHVAPSKTSADEYLLKLADHDDSTFILSNDRFAEYHDYNAVSSGRVLRFLIADGRIMSNDIDISVNY